MTHTRLLVLILGPPVLVAGLYALTFPAPRNKDAALAARVARAEARTARARANELEVLTQTCALAGKELAHRLPAACVWIARPPFVLAGDLGEDQLDRLYRDAVLPVTSALWRAYFDRRPDQPVIIIALQNEAVYRAAALALDGYEPVAYAGYTQRSERRIVLNIGTGQGTLAHELSHVLALFDFPEMPEWFDEGLAALHEDAVFTDDGLLLVGSSNWRTRLLREALAARELPSLEAIVLAPDFRGEGEGLNYAWVRSFCQYLQDRGVLGHFYRKLRAGIADDPGGLSTLCELLGARTTTDVDREFHAWLRSSPSRD